MGRRKIEIRPIKDDRNRSVTFLKRKGGLFKKAYELGVLCQVDVAVIIFGNNKKLYEFSSGDINETISRFQYFPGTHEHKGPDDFAGKGGDDDEDEDADMGSPPQDSPPDPPHTAHSVRSQPSLQHVRSATPATVSSPPLPNGSIKQEMRASPSVQPNHLSRPASRTAQGRRPSNLVPPQYTPPMATMQHPSFQHPSAGHLGVGHPSVQHHGAPHPQQHFYPPPQPPNMPHSAQYPPAIYQQQAHPGMHHLAMQEEERHHRRQSLPPHFQQQPLLIVPPQHHQHPPQHHHMQSAQSMPTPRRPSPHPHDQYQSPPVPQPRVMIPTTNKSQSIFTPIEESRSLLAQHWGAPPSADTVRQEQVPQATQPVDLSQFSQVRIHQTSPQLGKAGPPEALYHNIPTPSEAFYHSQPPVRSGSTHSLNSAAASGKGSVAPSDARRPRLKVQIPSEQSDGSDEAGETSAMDATATQPMINPGNSKPVVLPPPSPSSKNPLLSAGATGPPNPFARPAPPLSSATTSSTAGPSSGSATGTGPNNLPTTNRDQLETPLSALPSRVMKGDNNLLPSPSDLWSNMFSRSGNDNMMPSPLNFQPTPIAAHPPGAAGAFGFGMRSASAPGGGPAHSGPIGGGEEEERKRRAEGEVGGQGEKRIRT